MLYVAILDEKRNSCAVVILFHLNREGFNQPKNDGNFFPDLIATVGVSTKTKFRVFPFFSPFS
jgi:hypothetical protein